jgi:mRNA interferase MazF
MKYLCTVVPISGDPGQHETDYVVRLEFKPPLPDPFSYETAWAKCDMLATVCFERLDLFRTERDQYGKRTAMTMDPRRVQNFLGIAIVRQEGKNSRAAGS